MSQKIDGGITALSTLRPVTTPARTAATSDGTATQPVEATDNVRLTGTAPRLQTMQRELSSAPSVDNARVQAVRQSLDNGSYKINPDVIAQRMMDLDGQLSS